MPDLDREVGGLRCRQVLAILSDYVDGELSPADVQRVESHLRACDHCEKFGGEYASLVTRLRSNLVRPTLGAQAHARLASRVEQAWSTDEG